MKNLDEVIDTLEKCTGPDIECDGCIYTATNAEGVTICNNDQLEKDALQYLKMYRSDQIQWEADRKGWQDQYSRAVEDFEAAKARHLEALKELKERDRQKWISVSDRMPENDHTMAVRTVTQKGVVSWNRAWWDGEFWHGSGSMANVTHWMPISTEVA